MLTSKRRSRHPLLKFFAERRIWFAILAFIVVIAPSVQSFTTSGIWRLLTAVLCGIVAALAMVALGEYIHLQLSVERSLRRMSHSDGDERNDTRAS